ncbi:MAG: hypothetical protein APF84_13660 [Gracilibacter sp. BRH_c7a]|nr:MAG: hypothetical protein APF84_13660 [Gracilibacter sp. BRH_c7a]
MVDLTYFNKANVLDTCSIWNIISSNCLFSVAQQAGCSFYMTSYVLYECLYKPRKEVDSIDLELQNRLRKVLERNIITRYSLDLEDLQDVEILERRKKLGKGELSSIVFAKKFRQSIITDDQKARKLARTILDASCVQTTPQLFGWLFFINFLADADKDTIIQEHNSFKQPLEKYFLITYEEALRLRLISGAGKVKQ